ncbi:hypothetical protein JCM30237_07610 [Halolamina litorea]|uniref:DUF7260 domain-containing protein n=1 Tax=Halolamina litorea TaxID=1515593 RepID=A0ABD6BRU8_9EURY|nr:hypothetical protein [Halolamina litorea]
MPASYSLAPEIDGGVATCSGAFGCVEAVAGSVLALLLWAGLTTGLLFAPRANVRAAVSALEEEIATVVTEHDALSAFTTRVEKLPTAGPTTTVGAGGVGVVGAGSHSAGMAKLKEAYRDTVMAVDHYERDYNEPFADNFANEFGEGVAGAVLANERLSPQVKRAVLASAAESRTQRQQYRETLERERERLRSAGDALDRAATRSAELDGDRLRRRPFTELRDRYERLESERCALQSALETRQQELHEGVTFGWQRRDAESVYRYLYRDIDATYPVLADGARVLDRFDDVEHRLTTALTAKV